MGAAIKVEYTDKPISPYGGLETVKRFYLKTGLREIIEGLPLPEPGSNRGYNPVTLVEGFLMSVILGASRLTHTGLLRYDKVISEMFGWKRGMASESTFSRFFRKHDVNLNDEIFLQYGKAWFEKVWLDKHTVDIDSTVITRYGSQGGVRVGYNPKKRGRGSHHPIIAFSAESKMVIQSWMRTGNSISKTDFEDFLDEIIRTISKDKIGLVRADSGFFSQDVLEKLEDEELQYIIAAKMFSGLVQRIFDEDRWRIITPGIDICSFTYKLDAWDTARRFVVVRKQRSLYPRAVGKSLFVENDEFEDYLYSAFVTNSDLSAELIWELYKNRATAETQIRELKENYGLDGFCCEEFGATEAAFRWVCVAYNLMSLYKILLLNKKHDPNLTTLKFQCIAIAGYLTRHGRKKKLILSAHHRRRDFLEDLFLKIEKVDSRSRFRPRFSSLMN